MTSTPAILWETFGLTGLAAVVAWAGAVLLLAIGLVSQHRWTHWVVAAGAGIVGVALAATTSAKIRGIEVDRSAEVLAAEAAGAQATLKKFRSRAADIRFAEDTAVDQADLAGASTAEEEGAYERAVAEQLAKAPAYRSRGKLVRAGGRAAAADDSLRPGEPLDAADPGGADPAASAAATNPEARKLPESHLVIADRFDRGNRAAAWATLLVSFGLVGFEYIRRFHSPFNSIWPLPLAGTAIDGLATKHHVVVFPTDREVDLAPWLEGIVRKGESFLLFVDADPLPGRDRLPRFMAWPRCWLQPLHHVSSASLSADPSLTELAFESAWFGRGSSIIIGEASAGDVLDQLAASLSRRRTYRATARRTLAIVWSLPIEPPAQAADAIARLAASTNVCWIR